MSVFHAPLHASVATFALALAMLGASQPAFAQSTDSASTTTASQDGDGQGGGEVVVTGSRIARPDLVNPMPVGVVKMDDALRFNGNDISAILTQNPALGFGGSTLNSASNGLDSGARFINLRNLGTNRSLTLIDGKRRVSGSTRSSAVDIGTIPLGMIDRVEIITGGAAAVYGADAVTGAVNIITRKSIDKTTISVTGGLSERGDAGQGQASISTGFSFADGRGRVSFGATYSRTDSLYMYDRYDWTQQPLLLPNLANTGTADGIPDRIHVWNYRQHYYAYEPNFWLGTVNGQAVNTRFMLTDGGTVRPMVHEIYMDRAPTQFALGSGGDGRNLVDMNQLRGGEKSVSTQGRAEFDIASNLTWAGYFSYSKNNYNGAGTYYRDDTRTTFMGVGSAKAYLDNPFLPASIRAVMQQYGLTSVNIDRTYGNFPVRDQRHYRETFTLGTELAGKIGSSLNWSAFYQYGQFNDHAVEGDVPVKSRWLAARDVITGPSGLPVCRDPAARAAGCIPLNIFSTATPTKELLDWVLDDRDEYRKITQQSLGAEINGSLFRLPAGAVKFALGAEYRRDTLENRDDPLALSGELVYGGGPSARSQLNVEADVKEVFAELVVPVFADKSFARRFDVELAYRYSDYNTVGGTHAWKAGTIWEPVRGLALRAVRSRSVRTPNFGELYEPMVTNTTLGSIVDPCEAGDIGKTPTREANCRALGVTTPLPDIKTGPHVTTGGNPALRPETSNSLTVGVVWQPRFIPNFDVTVDYWDIKIKDIIYQLSYTQIMNLCVDLPTIDNQYCAALGRNQTPNVPTQQHGILLPAGAPLYVNAQQGNIAQMRARGIDVSMNYALDVGAGRAGLRLAGTYLLDHVFNTTPGAPAGDIFYDGQYNYPKLRANLVTSYDIGRFGVALNTRYQHGGKGDNMATAEQYDINDVPSRTYFDLSARYGFGAHTLNFSVNNLTDTMPPYLAFGEPGIYAASSVYDLVGRSYSLTYTLKF
ncbi:TonB-dependent receptor plug domain-containing protein [Sphingomonas sp.]|uniref:TonB-dependent receptor plug domain-containing protein n=1 Tax=Sphingomonas sp. TaxID=28214 RepID=UPI002DD63DF4|nr:TonB-dependent receptor [Sphingomonas sp.]